MMPSGPERVRARRRAVLQRRLLVLVRLGERRDDDPLPQQSPATGSAPPSRL